MSIITPICFYPTQKIILDDDECFAQSIIFKSCGKYFRHHANPQEALDYLLGEYKTKLNKDLIVREDTDNQVTNQSITYLSLDSFSEIFVQDNLDISVILVDYHMPNMCGLDFLEKIRHLRMKKILITAESNYEIGIDAFNAGLVDGYIRKDKSNFHENISTATAELEWKYFTDFSDLVMTASGKRLPYLYDSSLFSLVKSLINKKDITSFYLSDTEGDFIINHTQNAYQYLIVRSKEQLSSLAKIAKEDGASEQVITQLERNEIIPFFKGKKFWDIPASQWDKYTYEAKSIPQSDDLFWTMID